MSSKLLLVPVLVAFLLALSQSASVSRIYGGRTASEGQFPYQVSLRLNGTHICGGSIITDRVIITAARCVAKFDWVPLPVSYFQVYVGSNDLISGGRLINVTDIQIHRLYSNRLNDLSVMKLAEILEFSETIQPIELNQDEVEPGTDVIVSGWGIFSNFGGVPDLLQYNQLQTISKNKCFTELGLRYNFLLCLTHASGNGLCDTDVGGPVVYNGTLVAVAGSKSQSNCGTNEPDTSASIAYYYSWIMMEVNGFHRN